MDSREVCEAGHSGGRSEEIWRFLVDYEPVLRKRCRSVLRNQSDAEDAVGELRLRLFDLIYTQPDRLGAITNVEAWLRRIAGNYCIDHIRSRSPLVSYMGEAPESDTMGCPRNPEQEAATKDFIARILAAFELLPASLGRPLMSRSLGDDYEVIATTFCITAQNARKRVQLARKELKRSLGAFDLRDAH
jgi:RNA polymerase sigma-70 factor (ECF subfamily)